MNGGTQASPVAGGGYTRPTCCKDPVLLPLTSFPHRTISLLDQHEAPALSISVLLVDRPFFGHKSLQPLASSVNQKQQAMHLTALSTTA